MERAVLFLECDPDQLPAGDDYALAADAFGSLSVAGTPGNSPRHATAAVTAANNAGKPQPACPSIEGKELLIPADERALARSRRGYEEERKLISIVRRNEEYVACSRAPARYK
jgi:hypothetical protein